MRALMLISRLILLSLGAVLMAAEVEIDKPMRTTEYVAFGSLVVGFCLISYIVLCGDC